MGLFRALNLLQAVENTDTDGTALESILTTSDGQSAEFAAMLSTRHMARRMAGNAHTMTAINASAEAIKIVFEQTSEYNFRPVEAITASEAAMGITTTTIAALNKVMNNATAFSYFIASSYYNTNILNTLATLINEDPANFSDQDDLILDNTPFSSVVTNVNAMNALVESTTAMDTVVANSAPITYIAADTIAMTIAASSYMSMNKIALSSTARVAIKANSRGIIINVPSAIVILGSNDVAWDDYLTGYDLSTDILKIMIALGGLDSDSFPTVASIFADAAASVAIASNKSAMIAVLKDSVAYTAMSNSPNLAAILGVDVALGLITPNPDVMGLLIGNPTAFAILLTNTAAKAAIFASTTLKGIMMAAGSTSLDTILGMGATYVGPVNNKVYGTFQTYGLAGNWIILTGAMGSIVGTTISVQLKNGDGTGVETYAVPGVSIASVYPAINAALTDPLITVNAISALAAGTFTSTVVDFN
jgi:hypothetical protein